MLAKNSRYMNRNIAPSFQLSLPIDRKYQKNKLVIREKMTRFWKTSMFMVKGVPISTGTKSVIPRIRVMFMKLLPMISPRASAG